MPQVAGQNLPQPGGQLGLGRTAKAGETAVRLEEGLLGEIGRVDLALQPPADLHAGQERQVIAITIEKLAQRLAVSRPRRLHKAGYRTDFAIRHSAFLHLVPIGS